MSTLAHSRQGQGITALASAVVVTAVLIQAPGNAGLAVAQRVEVAVVQLQSQVTNTVGAAIGASIAPVVYGYGISSRNVDGDSSNSTGGNTSVPETDLWSFIVPIVGLLLAPILLPIALVTSPLWAPPVLLWILTESPLRWLFCPVTCATGTPSSTASKIAGGPARSASSTTSTPTSDPPTSPAVLSPVATTALAASNATVNSGDDPFTSVGRVALNVVGALLSPLWYLAFPITQGLGSLYGYVPPFFDPSGIFSAFNTIANFGRWLSFPFRLGEVLFPPSVPQVTPTLSAATMQSIQSDAGATAAPAVAGLAIAAETTRPVATADTSGRGSVQRNARSTNAAAAATVRVDSTPSLPATMTPLETSAAPDVPEPAVMSVALDKRDDVPSVTKANAASSRHAAGRSGAKDEAPQRP